MSIYLLSKNPEIAGYLQEALSFSWESPILVSDENYLDRIPKDSSSTFIITKDLANEKVLSKLKEEFSDSTFLLFKGLDSEEVNGDLLNYFDLELDEVHLQKRNINLLKKAIEWKGQFKRLKKINKTLLKNLQEWESFFRDALDLIFIIDGNTKKIIDANTSACVILGYSKEELIGKDFTDIFRTEAHLTVDGSGFYGSTLANHGLLTKENKWIPMESTWRLITRNGQTNIIVSFRDISERKEAENKIHQLAYFDPLTKLPNKALFSDKIKELVLQAKGKNLMFGLVTIDIDNFKLVNETLGSDTGNVVIQRVGERLKEFSSQYQLFLAHFGGDDYAIIVENIKSSDDLEYIVQKLQDFLRKPIDVDNKEFYLTYSMGLSLYPIHGSNYQDIIKTSYMAMYHSKEKGRNSYRLFSDNMYKELQKRLELENDLRKAIQKEEFLVYFQPQVRLKDMKICGMEALIRWKHPEKGFIPPGIFIPIAEITGLIKELGYFVLNKACSVAKRWIEKKLMDFPVSVNMSARQWSSVQITHEIMKVIQETGFPIEYLVLELTESSIMEDPENSILIFHDLVDKGIGFSVDDFGTGYSSLSYLKRLKVQHLKIDKSFIDELESSESDRSIASAIIHLAHSLNLEVIAEGVERKSQMEILKELGCDKIQGYFISKPLPEEEFEKFIKSYREGDW